MTDLNNDLPITEPLDLTDLVTITTNKKRIKKQNELDVTPKRIQEGSMEEDYAANAGIFQSGSLTMELFNTVSHPMNQTQNSIAQ